MQVQKFEAWLVSSSERKNLQKNEAKTQQLSHTQLRGPAFSLNKSPPELCWGGSSALCCTRCLWWQIRGTTELIILWNRTQVLAEESKELHRLWAPSNNLSSPLIPAHSRAGFSLRKSISSKIKGCDWTAVSYPHFFPPTDAFYLSLFISHAITISIKLKICHKISSSAGCLGKELLRFLRKKNLWVHKSFL